MFEYFIIGFTYCDKAELTFYVSLSMLGTAWDIFNGTHAERVTTAYRLPSLGLVLVLNKQVLPLNYHTNKNLLLHVNFLEHSKNVWKHFFVEKFVILAVTIHMFFTFSESGSLWPGDPSEVDRRPADSQLHHEGGSRRVPSGQRVGARLLDTRTLS